MIKYVDDSLFIIHKDRIFDDHLEMLFDFHEWESKDCYGVLLLTFLYLFLTRLVTEFCRYWFLLLDKEVK